jgi:hypothetical protein
MAAAWVVWPLGMSNPTGQAVPKAIKTGDQEIVWLYPAINMSDWERFVSAARRFHADRPDLLLDDSNAFPSQSTGVPELAFYFKSGQPRLWFRWYKLTGEAGTHEWVQALAHRNPPPLAIIGGATSDRARDLARELNDLSGSPDHKPLMMITTATADLIYLGEKELDLMEIYPNRSFRFGFTNKQMAKAVADFIWSHDELRPDREPSYLVFWKDDPYSEDFYDHFREVVLEPERRIQNGPPAAPVHWSIPYSVGMFNEPNQWETDAVVQLVNVVSQNPDQKRPLLVLPATSQSARRFMRGLARTDFDLASRFVVATGDGIDFNTIYRDRNLAWPIQDLPCDLVFFCHRNPVDPSAFREDQPENNPPPPDPNEKTTTGTQDLLLYRDIVETIVEAASLETGWRKQPDEVSRYLKKIKLSDGDLRFSPKGNTRTATGVFVIWLKPAREKNRILPKATLQIWNGSAHPKQPFRWELKRELVLDYRSQIPVAPPEGNS